MEDEVRYSVKKLKKAFTKLQDAVQQSEDELDRDGVIQRFEFTFELFWKSLKFVLQYEGFHCAEPRSCIKEAAKRDLLKDGEILLDMLEDRNKTAHIYDENTAKEIFDRIEMRYIKTFEGNIKLFEDYLSEDNDKN